MSILTATSLIVTTINSSSGSTDLTITTANGSAFNMKLFANGGGLSVTNGASQFVFVNTSTMVVNGSFLPATGNTFNLGNSTLRWATIYTQDVELNNGIGDYTIVEGEDDLFLYNNKKGKVYKFALIEVDPAFAPPKKNGN